MPLAIRLVEEKCEELRVKYENYNYGLMIERNTNCDR